MSNDRLKFAILEIVENQIKMDDPPCAGRTFRRLVSSGYTDKEAKEMIGAVLIEDIYFILKDKQSFDVEKYSKRLDDL